VSLPHIRPASTGSDASLEARRLDCVQRIAHHFTALSEAQLAHEKPLEDALLEARSPELNIPFERLGELLGCSRPGAAVTVRRIKDRRIKARTRAADVA
jgi:hypothetical protein